MISVRFEPELLAALDSLGKRVNRSRSELLEEGAAKLIEAYRRAGKVRRPKSS